MELMQEPMVHRREEDRGKGEKRDTAEKRVERGKQFPGICIQVIDRPHPGEDHRGVQKGIDPMEVSQKMISDCSEPDRKKKNQQRKHRITELPVDELPAAQQRFRVMFKRVPHVSRISAISIVKILAYFAAISDSDAFI